MALCHRLRRALSFSTTILSQSHRHRRTPTFNSLSCLLHPQPLSATPAPFLRQFHSTSSSLSPRSFKNTGKIDPDTIIFPGCDYNHWLIVMDFGKDPTNRPAPDQMVEAYVNTAAKVFGSVKEAKKRIYACSTATYTGFHVLADEQTSQKFEGLPGVILVLPDGYIDPINKEYGGDKYIKGKIIPRPPPVQYVRPKQGIRQNDQSMKGPSQYQQGSPPYNQHGSMRGDGGGYMSQEPQWRNRQNYQPQQNFGPRGQGDMRHTVPTGGQYPPGQRGHYPDGQNHGLPGHQGNFSDVHNYPQGQISNNLRTGGDYVPQGQFNNLTGDQRYNSQGQIGNNVGGYPSEQQICNSPGDSDGYLPHGQIGNSPGGPGGYVPQGQMSSIPGGPRDYPSQGQMGISRDNSNYNPPSAASMPYEQSGAGQDTERGGWVVQDMLQHPMERIKGFHRCQEIETVHLGRKLE